MRADEFDGSYVDLAADDQDKQKNILETVYYVYLLIDPRDMIPFYVGKGKGNRAQSHLTETSSKGNRLKKSIIRKIRSSGAEPLIEFFQTELTEIDALSIEAKLIKKYGRRDLGLGPLSNMTDGGEGVTNRFVSEATKDKISKSRKGKRFSESHRSALSIAAKLRKRKPLSDETKEKIRLQAKNRKHSVEAKQKISMTQKGKIRKPRDEETKRKISLAQKGKSRLYAIGLKRSQETCIKISNALKGRIKGPLSFEVKQKISQTLKTGILRRS